MQDMEQKYRNTNRLYLSDLILSVKPKTADSRANTDHIGCLIYRQSRRLTERLTRLLIRDAERDPVALLQQYL